MAMEFWRCSELNGRKSKYICGAESNTSLFFTMDYTAQLIATSNAGCKASIDHTFTVNGAVLTPLITLENTTALCSNTNVVIKDASKIDAGNIIRVEILWDQNDASIKTVDNSPARVKYTRMLILSLLHLPRKIIQLHIMCIQYSLRTNFSLPITVLATPQISFYGYQSCLQQSTSIPAYTSAIIERNAGFWSFQRHGCINSRNIQSWQCRQRYAYHHLYLYRN